MRPSISIAIAGLLWFSTYVYAQPNKQLYEQQERCGKRAAEVFKRKYSPPVAKIEHGQMTFRYENHYSSRLSKCFFLEIANAYERIENRPFPNVCDCSILATTRSTEFLWAAFVTDVGQWHVPSRTKFVSPKVNGGNF